MKIAGKELRPGREAFIVAEIGINHGGSVSRSIEIIDQLHASGAKFDAVKLQYYRTERLCSSAVPEATRCVLKACELHRDEVDHVLAYAKTLGYAGIVTVFNGDDLNDVRKSPEIDALKVASPDAVNVELIKAVAGVYLPIIVSTGTCDAAETDALAALLKEVAPGRHAMLECVSQYPANGHTCPTVAWMSMRYRDAAIGYSCHYPSTAYGAYAAEFGACIIEAHVMHADGQGIDAAVSFSATPFQFGMFCESVRRCRDPFDEDAKVFRPEEGSVRLSARQSVVLRRDVAAGETIKLDNITVKRPGTGIPAARVREVIGKVAARPIKADVPVQWEDLEGTPPQGQ